MVVTLVALTAVLGLAAVALTLSCFSAQRGVCVRAESAATAERQEAQEATNAL